MDHDTAAAVQMPFVKGGGNFDHPLQQITLRSAAGEMTPESLERFMRLPPIRVIVQVDRVEIILIRVPIFRREDLRFMFLSKGMAFLVSNGMRMFADDESIRWKRTGGIADVRGLWNSVLRIGGHGLL